MRHAELDELLDGLLSSVRERAPLKDDALLLGDGETQKVEYDVLVVALGSVALWPLGPLGPVESFGLGSIGHVGLLRAGRAARFVTSP